MKITKNTLKQLIKEELAATLNENGNEYLDDAIGQAYADAERDIAAKVAGLGSSAADPSRVEEMYIDAYSAGLADGREGVDLEKGQWEIKPSTSSTREFYSRGHNDVTRILQAPLTPAEDEHANYQSRPFEDWGASFKPQSAEGPYATGYLASRRAAAKELTADRVKARQAERGGAPYQALGDAAVRGSLQALRRLQKAAKADPEAQAILDAIEDAKRSAQRMSGPPPLSADQEADMLEQIIREETKAVMKERSRRSR